MMQTMVANNAVHGLLAYCGAECVGWVAVDPMQTLAGHDCQQANSTGEWSIHCLFVKTGFRSQGISTKLIEAAIRHAQSNGASLVSAFPIPEASRSNYPAHEAEFSGRYSTYFKLGFRPTGSGDSFYQRVELPLTRHKLSTRRLTSSNRPDFFQIHCKENGEGWCNCVAWWVPTWDGWGDRSTEQNLALRNELFDRGEFDGYMLYLDDQPIGWCQCGPRDRLSKLVKQYNLELSGQTWAVTCFVLAANYRGKGYAQIFLKDIVADLFTREISHIQGFPRVGDNLAAGETWTGTGTMFEASGFTIERPHDRFPIYGIRNPSALSVKQKKST